MPVSDKNLCYSLSRVFVYISCLTDRIFSSKTTLCSQERNAAKLPIFWINLLVEISKVLSFWKDYFITSTVRMCASTLSWDRWIAGCYDNNSMYEFVALLACQKVVISISWLLLVWLYFLVDSTKPFGKLKKRN